MVPWTGRPYILPAWTLLVPMKPPIKLDLATMRPACIPWVRRREKSTSRRSPAAWRQREALVATNVGKFMELMTKVSTNWACITGAVISTRGSSQKAIRPSGIALTSPVKRSFSKNWRNLSGKSEVCSKYSRSSGRKWKDSR